MYRCKIFNKNTINQLSFCLDETFLTYKPSEIAASIVCVARICTGLSTAWNPHLEEATCYSLESLQPIASYMLR